MNIKLSFLDIKSSFLKAYSYISYKQRIPLSHVEYCSTCFGFFILEAAAWYLAPFGFLPPCLCLHVAIPPLLSPSKKIFMEHFGPFIFWNHKYKLSAQGIVLLEVERVRDQTNILMLLTLVDGYGNRRVSLLFTRPPPGCARRRTSLKLSYWGIDLADTT